MINTQDISSRQSIEEMLQYINDNAEGLKFHRAMFDIFEGELLPYVEKALAEEISYQSYLNAKPRIPPINILQRLVDKRSKIYQQNPVRSIVEGQEKDKELLEWYVNKMKFDEMMNNSNELYNLSNSTLLQPFVDNGVPCLRSIPKDRFLVYSDNKINPMIPTLIITCHGYDNKKYYHAYTDRQFISFDQDGIVMADEMMAVNNPTGINPYGKLPFIYINRSNNLLIPKLDKDTMQMSILFPILMTDLNYAVKFQSFSIVYVVDADDKNLVAAPNAVWMFKSDPNSEKKPEVGTIKPQVDISEVVELIKTEFALWLSTKGLKPGSVGEMDSGNVASGLSKIIDEMDTSEDRQKQATRFSDSERELWDLILNYMHPVWSQAGMIENKAVFSPSAYVSVAFAEQLPISSRGTIVRDLKDEVTAGFITRERAIKRLNPEMSESQVDELLVEIEEERNGVLDEEGSDQGGNQEDSEGSKKGSQENGYQENGSKEAGQESSV